MKRRCAAAVLMAFLLLGVIQVQAGEKDIQTEYVTITDLNRFEEEYYQKPQVRYPVFKNEMYRASRAQQDLEQYVVEALENYQEKIDISAYQLSREEAFQAIFQILNHNPGIFYVDGRVGTSYNPQTNLVTAYSVTYLGAPEEIDRQRQELELAADQAAEQADPSMSEAEKALVVHDYLVQNCEYDFDRLGQGQVSYSSHTAYGALVDRIAVCDGYGDAYAYIMEDKLGIPCELVSSEVMAHAWNMIRVDGEWYHVDATWDDPTRDCIGRVGHNFFLLSDTAISDNNHGHEGWSTNLTADSTLYDNAFWKEITSSICYVQGEWYYSKFKSGDYNTMGVQLLKKDGLMDGTETELYKETAWTGPGNMFYNMSCMYPVKANDMLYFNTRTTIYRFGADGTAEKVYEPQIPAGKWIYGFTVRGKELWYALQSSPDSDEKQEILIYKLPELELPELEGISAENVTAVYDGNAQKITVSGTQAGDVVQYAGEDKIYRNEQPEMINAGVYQVRYQVKRQGFQPFEGEVQLEITKAVPVYTVPSGLKGDSGKTLASIILPQGFTWQTDTETELSQEGSRIFLAEYLPEDSGNYEVVKDIEIEVLVSCPGHEYITEIVKEPSEAQNGEAVYTCVFCGYSYKEEIDASLPQIQGIQAENTKAVYSGTAHRFILKGILPEDVVKYAGEDGVYGTEQPELVNAGIYQVQYLVERQGCQPFRGTVQMEITKAVPLFTVPSGLKGESGKTLASIKLPEGFVWQTSSAVKLLAEGIHTWRVTYVPEDTGNYQTVQGIEVKVAVKCPGHQYQSRVTRPATETRNGLKTYTCSLCGTIRTEEIPKSGSGKPGDVSGLKIKKNTANSLVFSWDSEANTGYYLVLYKGSVKVSERYETGGACTFGGLKAAADYTLKITPYRIVNGRRIFAASSGEIRTATAPAAVKLNSVKKSGKNKAKLAWKTGSGASGYEIFMKTGKGSYKKIKTIAKGTAASYSKAGLKKGKTYRFRLRAYKTVGRTKVCGAYSKTKTIKLR